MATPIQQWPEFSSVERSAALILREATVLSRDKERRHGPLGRQRAVPLRWRTCVG